MILGSADSQELSYLYFYKARTKHRVQLSIDLRYFGIAP